MPSRGWNPLLQPELDGSHVKHTQKKYRQSRCHKAQHTLESFERTGGTFLEGGREALDRRRSWARVLGTSGRGSVRPSISALSLINPQEVGAPGWLPLV